MKLNTVWYFLATGFGIGTLSWIPTGTIASLLAIPVWWILIYFYSYKIYYILLIIGIGSGIYFCGQTSKRIGIHDHESIVWDEIIGMWITLVIIPIYSWFWIIIAFLVFRILDILKPWPISWCDRKIKGGLGIMIDDIVASTISVCIILYLMNISN